MKKKEYEKFFTEARLILKTEIYNKEKLKKIKNFSIIKHFENYSYILDDFLKEKRNRKINKKNAKKFFFNPNLKKNQISKNYILSMKKKILNYMKFKNFSFEILQKKLKHLKKTKIFNKKFEKLKLKKIILIFLYLLPL